MSGFLLPGENERVIYRWPDGAYLYVSATDPDPAQGWVQVSKTRWTLSTDPTGAAMAKSKGKQGKPPAPMPGTRKKGC